MMSKAKAAAKVDGLAHQIAAVREFNRSYTRQIGVLNREFLKTPFSLAEVRVLLELYYRDSTTAAAIGQSLGLDGGYLSRILRGFARKGLMATERSPTDGRQSLLRLSKTGRRAFEQIEERQRSAVKAMLHTLSPSEIPALVGAMRKIERLLALAPQPKVPYMIRSHQPGDMGWIIHRQGVLYNEEYGWDEHFEAVIARITSDFILGFDPRTERCWIAEREGEIVGSIFCVAKSKHVARLRLLYVEPSARELGIGSRLVDECIRFAQRAGYHKLTLWTNSVLHSARRIYERNGFELVHEEAHHSYGRDLKGQTWDLDLRTPESTANDYSRSA